MFYDEDGDEGGEDQYDIETQFSRGLKEFCGEVSDTRVDKLREGLGSIDHMLQEMYYRFETCGYILKLKR